MNDVCSVVITYNRKEDLLINLNYQLKQNYNLDILIVDNCSTDGTYAYLQNQGIFTKNVMYHRTEQNIGGAGGFAIGLEIVHKAGYKFAWLMDDDGYPLEKDTLSKLISAYNDCSNKNIILNSLVTQKDEETLTFGLNSIYYNHQLKNIATSNIYRNFTNPFNGTLIPCCLLNELGYPKKEFFLGCDEVEYLLRAKSIGIDSATVLDSLYYHPYPPNEFCLFLGKTVARPQMKIWKMYYRIRNTVFTYKKYGLNLRLIKFLLNNFIRVLLFSKDQRICRLKYVVFGFLDGYKGDFSKSYLHTLPNSEL